MKKSTKRILSLMMTFVMVVSTLVYVNADALEEIFDTAVIDELASGDSVTAEDIVFSAEESEVVEDVEAALAGGNYSTLNIAEGAVIADDDNFTVTALSALDGTGKGTGINSAYVNVEDNSVITCRPYLKIVAKTTGNITINSPTSAKKSSYIVKDTGDTAHAEWSGSGNSYSGDVPVVEVTAVVSVPENGTAVTEISAFIEAGNTYYFAPAGTSPKMTGFSFEPGDAPAESTTESTTEAQVDDLEDINNIQRTAPSNANDGAKHTIWVLGDSTACYYGTDSNYVVPRNGYGMAFGKGTQNPSGGDVAYTTEGIFDNANVEVYNLAISGISSKSFTSNNNYKILTSNWKAGDYVLIGFGHNDQKDTDTARFTSASMGADGWNVDGQFANSIYKNYILPAVKAGVTPVIVTSIVRRSRTSDTISGSSVHNCATGDYRQTAIDLAKKFDLPCIDITYNTYMEYIALGKGEVDGSTGYGVYGAQYNDKYLTSKGHVNDDGTFKEEQRIDNTHLNAKGAKTVAYFIAQDIQGNEIEYGVAAETPLSPTPVLTESGNRDSTDKALENLATFLGAKANEDPRVGGGEEDSTESTTEGFEVYLEAGDTANVKVGETFDIYVNVKNNEGISKVDFDLTFDNAAVELTGLEAGDLGLADNAALAALVTAEANAAGKVTISGAAAEAAANDGCIAKATFKLLKYGEGTFGLSGKVNDSDAAAFTGTSLFLDYNQDDDPDGLTLKPVVGTVADGKVIVDYVLSGNKEGLGLNNATLAVNYDASVIKAIGKGNASEVGIVADGKLIEAIIDASVIDEQVAVVPEAGDADYKDADGTKTAAELGTIKVAGYLSDNDGDSKVDVAYNNGILFSIQFEIVDAAADTSNILKAAGVNVTIPSKGGFGSTDAAEADVTILDNYGQKTGLVGDVDQSGYITANDAAALLTYIRYAEAKKDSWIVENYIADVNNDNEVTTADAAQILKKAINSAFQFERK